MYLGLTEQQIKAIKKDLEILEKFNEGAINFIGVHDFRFFVVAELLNSTEIRSLIKECEFVFNHILSSASQKSSAFEACNILSGASVHQEFMHEKKEEIKSRKNIKLICK